MITDRREVLALLSALIASASASPVLGKSLRSIGLQLYTVRDLLERDFEGTLAEVARLGYRQVEFAGMIGPSPEQTQTILKRHGLIAPASHVSYEQLERELSKHLQVAGRMDLQFIVCPSVDASRRATIDDWKRICQTFNTIGARAKDAGLSFVYHNHDFEFLPVDGQVPYDVVLAETDPDLVKMEADLYWMTKAGRDPVTYFQRYPGRFPLLHLKDMARDRSITEVGQGIVDFKSILGHSELAGVAYCFVEHDHPVDPLQSIGASLRYLQQMDI
ncbi:sugar phosphate isomerase/epimerase [Nitrobacteraceae bacterium AZCC 1564]